MNYEVLKAKAMTIYAIEVPFHSDNASHIFQSTYYLHTVVSML